MGRIIGWLTFFACSTPAFGGVVELGAAGHHTCALYDKGELKCWGSNGDGQLGIGRKGGVWKKPSELPFVNLGEGARAVQVVLGDHHTCALLDSGEVKCWGRNSFGQTGATIRQTTGEDPEEMANLAPVTLPQGTVVSQIATSETVSCAVTGEADVWCWGDVRDDGPTKVFEMESLKGAKQITLGADFGCARFGEGGVKCWGVNDEGQLGVGLSTDRFTRITENLAPVQLGGDAHAISISAGMSHACALLTDGRLKCWGANGSGQLGLGDRQPRGRTPLPGNEGLSHSELGSDLVADAISCGTGNHCCARVREAATVKCWGANGNGQAGGDLPTNQVGDEAGEMGDELPFMEFGALARVKKLAMGGSHSCGLLEDGRVMCWGYDISPRTRAFSRVPLEIKL